MGTQTDRDELFDPEFLGRLRLLFLKLRKRRQLKRRGVQATPAAGHTREFKDHRHYVPGDDYRAIDWKLFARLERLFIRIFEEVQEFHIQVLLDRSCSMREPYPEKRILALRLTVALAYLGLVSQHRVSILSLAEGVQRLMPPLKGQGHIHAVLDRLASLQFDGVTDLEGSLRQFRPSRDRRGIIFLVSDLFGREAESARESLRRAVTWPAELHVIHLLHPSEKEPNLEGENRLVEVETGEVRRMWLTRREAEAYRRAVTRYLEDLKQLCLGRQLDYLCWTTDQAFEEMFLGLLSRGSALAGG